MLRILCSSWGMARHSSRSGCSVNVPPLHCSNMPGNWSFLQHLILPAVSLIVVSLAYSVLLLLLKPVMEATLHNIYNWVFIVGILACAGWLVMAVLNQSASLTALLTDRKLASLARICAGCGAGCNAADKFCRQCGND